MTLDLPAARALHDRDPNDPGKCRTCCDSYGNPAAWPCETALALGATGRTEWDDSPAPASTHIRVAFDTTRPEVNHTPSFYRATAPALCGRPDPNSTATCNRSASHDHHHAHGTTMWAAPPCSATHPDDRWCILQAIHDGPHYWADGGTNFGRCTTVENGLTCALSAGHRTRSAGGKHVTWLGGEWLTTEEELWYGCTADNEYREGHNPEHDYRCTLADEHAGPHHWQRTDQGAERCQTTSQDQGVCARVAGHPGKHTTPYGNDWAHCTSVNHLGSTCEREIGHPGRHVTEHNSWPRTKV